jgi:hypothetical protein
LEHLAILLIELNGLNFLRSWHRKTPFPRRTNSN